MKTATVELPDDLARRAEAFALARGKTLPELVLEALTDKVAGSPNPTSPEPYAWREAFGAFSKDPEMREDTRRMQELIDQEFGQIEPEDWK